ncbi:cytochrome c heme-lyase [Capronia coronata CBS 617.96]|uniref:Holocytochrome c-type synthase n=1 Tax=Capronia coronata CBS 617.96 TaxID=1182541 RepID=W9Y8H1_9EURO|nr:cytochrome c heme-lyase [Capronia coronata CBS 617.96]EXJ85910.1 cytochrome c heme-lyase [Capronia coronata CBS 617.96]
MGWWKADPVPDSTPLPPPPTPQVLSHPPHPIPPQSTSDPASACPVDPKTRALWLQQAQKKSQSQSQSQPATQTNTPLPSLPPLHPTIPLPSQAPQQPATAIKPTTSYGSFEECSSDRISQSPNTEPQFKTPRPLSQERAVSSIPRAIPSAGLGQSPATPMNNEAETGVSSSGNWIYPSESQFFNAVMRKQTSSNPADLVSSISHIIPIHNAVNERAWSLIKSWEGDSSAACGGPKLLSFKGLGSGAKSPKARVKTFMGYTEPFDRHDWVVERCDGQTVEYVIDFYQGKSEPQTRDTALNFYLDVRPKLNTFEGWKMRAERSLGWR